MLSVIPPQNGQQTHADLLRVSRDTLRRAGATPQRGKPVPALVEQLGLLSELLGAVNTMLGATRDELWRRERAGTVSAVDGVFTGEAHTALTTMDLWMDRARTGTTEVRGAVENAHVATAGLADPR